jgi:hypothetical protein
VGGEPSRTWVRFQTTAHFFVLPWVGAHFVEQGNADDPRRASVVIFLGGVRFAHRAEAKGRHRFRALPKSSHQLLRWIKNITAFAKRSGSTIDDVESVDRKHNLKTKVASVPHTMEQRRPSSPTMPSLLSKDPGMTISFPFLPRFRFNTFAHE